MELFTNDNLTLLLKIGGVLGFLVAVVKFIQVCTAGIYWTFALSRKRDLAQLRKRREHLTQLKESDRAYYGRLLSGMLLVLALLGIEMALQGAGANTPQGAQLTAVVQNVFGIAVFGFAFSRFAEYRWLQQFDKHITRLDRAIAKLEAKMPRPA